MCPEITLLDQEAVIQLSCLVCYLEDQYCDIHTPNILDYFLGDSISISFPPSCDRGVSLASLSDSRHFTSECHLKSIR